MILASALLTATSLFPLTYCVMSKVTRGRREADRAQMRQAAYATATAADAFFSGVEMAEDEIMMGVGAQNLIAYTNLVLSGRIRY